MKTMMNLKSKIKQAAVDGLVSTSLSFQNIKQTVRENVEMLTKTIGVVTTIANALYHQSLVIEEMQQDIDMLKALGVGSVRQMKENSLELSLPTIKKSDSKEEKPN